MGINELCIKLDLLESHYRKNLSLASNIRFGIEIEFIDALFNQVFHYIDTNINEIGSFQKENYSIWNLTIDESVQEVFDDKSRLLQ